MNHKRLKPRIKSNQIKMSAEVVSPTTHQNKTNDEGLSFEVRECGNGYCGDDVYTQGSPVSPVSPVSPQSPLQYYDDNCPSMLMRSDSSSVWTDPAPEHNKSEDPEDPEEVVEIHEVPEDPPKDTNINRIQLGENPETVALLHFLAGQGIDTTKLVTEHMMKYGSRVRVAQNDDGKIVGCLIFDNETDQSTLEGMSPEEIKKRVGPFIYMQILIVAPEHAVDADKRWKERLIASFLECVVKNGKIAIIRADADNHDTIQLYKSCGFFTMEDMGIPSYSSAKGNLEVMAYTPMGLEGTAQIFKKFYDMGARF